ncbi:DMT family transporter [Oryzicola mucosus]|uniref:DMT family transporter n=1 Tax=Oryzicola mucosus TaxID=2767425 RepID=A0A8J6U0V1_9HYPH|nr:DMT family transporter [Oryzicola mucosus]MBD0413218.1 DMT family transporter [Oryzicola mucosus]
MKPASFLSQRGENAIILGVCLMLFGNFMFALNDAMGKWLVASFSVGQVLFIRSIGAFLVLGPMVLQEGPRNLFSVDRPRLQFLRVMLATADTGFFYAAVIYLPLADVMTFYMAGPIYLAAMAHFFLDEKAGWRRWVAILAGFCGVIVALRPSTASLSLESLFALIGSTSFAMSMLLNRVLRGTSDSVLVTWQTVGALIVGAILCLTSWNPPGLFDIGAMMLLGIVSCAAHLMITRALKLAPASTLAPLQYTLLLWAVIFGAMFFGDLPDMQILVGSAIIVLSGLFIFHRQKVVTNRVPKENVPINMP